MPTPSHRFNPTRCTPPQRTPSRTAPARFLAGPLVFFPFLAQAKLEDVFKSAQENMNQAPGVGRLVALLLGAVAIVLLLALLQQRRQRSANTKPVNHQGKLLKEVLQTIPLKNTELKQLKQLADEQAYSSPLLLLLCPSLLAKAMQSRPAAEREALTKLYRQTTPRNTP